MPLSLYSVSQHFLESYCVRTVLPGIFTWIHLCCPSAFLFWLWPWIIVFWDCHPFLCQRSPVTTGYARKQGFPAGSEGKVSAYNAGHLGSIPGTGRSLGEGNGNLLRYTCLENPMAGEDQQTTVHGVAKSWTRLSSFTFMPVLHCYILSTKVLPGSPQRVGLTPFNGNCHYLSDNFISFSSGERKSAFQQNILEFSYKSI